MVTVVPAQAARAVLATFRQGGFLPHTEEATNSTHGFERSNTNKQCSLRNYMRAETRVIGGQGHNIVRLVRSGGRWGQTVGGQRRSSCSQDTCISDVERTSDHRTQNMWQRG